MGNSISLGSSHKKLVSLFDAVKENDTFTISNLVSSGANVNGRIMFTDFKLSPLEIAARKGYTESVIELLRHGAQVTTRSLIFAVKSKNSETLKKILEKTKPQLVDQVIATQYTKGLDRYYSNPLATAVLENNTEAAKLLLQYGANPNKFLLVKVNATDPLDRDYKNIQDMLRFEPQEMKDVFEMFKKVNAVNHTTKFRRSRENTFSSKSKDISNPHMLFQI